MGISGYGRSAVAIAWIAPVAGAVIGGIASKQSADAANKKKTTWTDQTTTQDPFFGGQMRPDIEEVLNFQRGLVQRGAAQLDSKGNVTYAPIPTGVRPGSPDSWTPAGDPRLPSGPLTTGGPRPGPGGPGAGDRPDTGQAGYPDQYTPIASESKAGKGKGKGKGTGAGNAGKAGKPAGPVTGPPATTGPNLSTPQGIFGEVAKRGLAAGDTATIDQARTATGNILGTAGGGGLESTGFEGYNPILDRQAQRLETDADSRVSRDLMLKFLDENNRGGGSGSAPGSGGGSGNRPMRPQSPMDRAVATFDPNSPQVVALASNPSAGVPDTMAVDSYFGDETRKIMDEGANEQELQSLIDAMAADVQRGTFRDRASMDAAAAGSGRFGGSTWAAMNRDLSEEEAQELFKSSSGIRVGDRESRRQARLVALQGVDQRDLGLLGANVSREGIAAGERASGAASAAAAAGNADQIALARRGQDLSALGGLMDYEQSGMGQLTGIGGQLSGDRLAAMGMIPGLEGIGLEGLRTTLGAGGGLVDMRGQDIQKQIAGQQAGIARQGMNQQAGMWNAGQQQNAVNNYLGTLMNIGSMGGTSRTQGQNVQPGLGVSASGAALMGGLGGAATGAGLYNQYRGY